MSEDPEFRTGLPLGYLNYTGIVHSESVNIVETLMCVCVYLHSPSFQEDQRRGEFFEKISHFFTKLLQYAPIDAAADQVSHFDPKIIDL